MTTQEWIEYMQKKHKVMYPENISVTTEEEDKHFLEVRARIREEEEAEREKERNDRRARDRKREWEKHQKEISRNRAKRLEKELEDLKKRKERSEDISACYHLAKPRHKKSKGNFYQTQKEYNGWHEEIPTRDYEGFTIIET